MSDLEFSGTNLLALTLVRALALELPNTRETCLRHPLSSVLAHEVRRLPLSLAGRGQAASP
jgi:hypothetical protein